MLGQTKTPPEREAFLWGHLVKSIGNILSRALVNVYIPEIINN